MNGIGNSHEGLAQAAHGGSARLAPGLYVVATPIGNLDDITLRALDTLRRADWIAAEDTRHTRHLLDRHGISGKLLPAHQHNEKQAAQRIGDLVQGGAAVAMVSDAGTPGISDPGAVVVAAVRAAGLPVIPVPGAAALATALSAAGLVDGRFRFEGFLPASGGARRKAIEALAGSDVALVLYEAPHRVAESVADLAAGLPGERTLVVCRELTKTFETISALPLAEAVAWFAADENRRRGEFVLLVTPDAAPEEGLGAEAERVLRLLLTELPVKSAAKLAAEITGKAKNALYERALQMKKDDAAG